MQKVYIYYNGQGDQRYFTAPSDADATAFLSAEGKKSKWASAFATHAFITATSSYWLTSNLGGHGESLIPKSDKLTDIIP